MKSDVLGRLKKSTVIRHICGPYIELQRKKGHERYLRTPDSWYLKTLKGIHTGQRCFIIGNGPSLRAEDLDELKGEYTFAANRIFKIFAKTDWRPTYYLAVDDKVIREVENDLAEFDFGHKFLRYGVCTIREATNSLTKIYVEPLIFDVGLNPYHNTTTYISEDVPSHVCSGGTVTFVAIQLAIYMGFKEIYLLGVDHNYSTTADGSGKIHIDPTVQDYFDNKKYVNMYPAIIDNSQYAYTIAREYCGNHGIVIRNATRGGKLEVFERVDFDDLF